MTKLFTQDRDFSASLWKKDENKKKRASQSTNNLVCWVQARDADGSDTSPSKQGFVPF